MLINSEERILEGDKPSGATKLDSTEGELIISMREASETRTLEVLESEA